MTATATTTTKWHAWVFATATTGVCAVGVWMCQRRYRKWTEKRLQELERKSWFRSLGMVRVKNNKKKDRGPVHLLELHPAFVDQHSNNDMRMESLGEYLSSIRPPPDVAPSMEDLPVVVRREMEASIAFSLLAVLGPHLTSWLVFPTLGTSVVSQQLERLAAWLAKLFTSFVVASQVRAAMPLQQDLGAAPISLFAILALSDLNSERAAWTRQFNPTAELDTSNDNDKNDDYKTPTSASDEKVKKEEEEMKGEMEKTRKKDENVDHSGDNTATKTAVPKTATLSPIESMSILGEVGYDPSFGDSDSDEDNRLVPNPFIMKEHWHRAIARMERRLMKRMSGNSESHTEEEEDETLPRSLCCDSRPLLEKGTNSSRLVFGRLDPMENTLHLERAENEKDNQSSYDPHSKALPPPVPINPQWLPGLHKGWGAATCTHSQRQVLYNRLLSVLLNRLGANYSPHVGKKGKTRTFVLRLTPGKEITRPSDLIQAIIDSGHKVEVCPRSCLTTFGMALCVKEEEEEEEEEANENPPNSNSAKTATNPTVKWTNIPLAFMTETGYETQDGEAAVVALPHGGIDLDITGRGILGDLSRTPLNIQHYMAIEGMCGWHSNHNVQVPWVQSVNVGGHAPMERASEVCRAVRLCALFAVVLNNVGTEMKLPMGGYGLTGVCNDTAAVTEYALRGSTSYHPLVSVGRYLMHSVRAARRLQKVQEQEEKKEEVKDLQDLVLALTQLPSDIHPSPSNATDSTRRMLCCQPPTSAFSLMAKSRNIMQQIQDEYSPRQEKEK